MRRIFVPPEAVSGNSISVCGDDVKHMRDVLRMKSGDKVTATCGRGMNYDCVIGEISEDMITLNVVAETPDTSELPVSLILFQALPKSDKMDVIIQKAVELGASEIVPMRSARSVMRLDEAKAAKKVVRWRRISEEAAKQSGRGIIPDVTDVVDFDEAVAIAKRCDRILIPYELCEKAVSMEELHETISEIMQAGSIGVFIGSEGGFERHEVDRVCEAGGRMISLGHRILRTETAGPAVLSVLMMLIEDKMNRIAVY
ncbi:MAG: 16S rRNA (uracil(1498)-N(3))-methyltransferase [Eubacterium sp.]|nr:16S rRNA (uracil(1498)-N(3))-methyltransferase [Eubacterium sp.]